MDRRNPAPDTDLRRSPDSVRAPRPGLRAAAVPIPASASRERMLLVEDHDFFLNPVGESLGDRYIYLVASSPEQALRILGENPVDPVILDMNLAGLDDGVDALRGSHA